MLFDSFLAVFMTKCCNSHRNKHLPLSPFSLLKNENTAQMQRMPMHKMTRLASRISIILQIADRDRRKFHASNGAILRFKCVTGWSVILRIYLFCALCRIIHSSNHLHVLLWCVRVNSLCVPIQHFHNRIHFFFSVALFVFVVVSIVRRQMWSGRCTRFKHTKAQKNEQQQKKKKQ